MCVCVCVLCVCVCARACVRLSTVIYTLCIIPFFVPEDYKKGVIVFFLPFYPDQLVPMQMRDDQMKHPSYTSNVWNTNPGLQTYNSVHH